MKIKDVYGDSGADMGGLDKPSPKQTSVATKSVSPVEVLEAAVKEAITGGWTINDWIDADDFEWEIEDGDYEGDLPCLKYGGMGETFYLGLGSMMLDHDFAKALWAKGKQFKVNGKTIVIENPNYWKAKLRSMVVAKDPIKYLSEHTQGNDMLATPPTIDTLRPSDAPNNNNLPKQEDKHGDSK